MPSKIDLSKPRQVVYQSFVGGPGLCPRCSGRLQQSRETYAVATRRGRKLLDSFVIGSDFGWFCVGCPVVVINGRRVREMLDNSLPHWDVGNEFCVEGIVDLDAIPEHKRHLPIGGTDNLMPLIKFQNPELPPPRKPLNRTQRQKRKNLMAKKLSGRKRTAQDGA